jgi:hypothetical protein
MPSKDALAYEVCLDLTAQELLALPIPSRMEGGDDICDGARGLRVGQMEPAAMATEDSVELELSAEEMLALLDGDE